MLLKSSLIALLLINIVTNDLYIIIAIFILLIILNIIFNSTLKSTIKKIGLLMMLYLITCLMQMLFVQEGKILHKVVLDLYFKKISFYITKEGIIHSLTNFIRLANLLAISSVFSVKGMINSNNKYQKVITNTVEMLPDALVLVKKRMKLKPFIRHILKEVKKKYNN